jgi:dTDP-4-dehydrorhamnose 3,5-epimerase
VTTVSDLESIADHRGSVVKVISIDSANFSGFGELYFSTVKAGVVKAWRRHTEMTVNLMVVTGKIRLVVLESLESAPELEIVLDGVDRKLVTIEPGKWFGFQGLSQNEAMLMNFANIKHDDLEVERLNQDAEGVSYIWASSESDHK